MSTVRMQCLPDLFHRAYNRHPVDRTAGKFRILLERLRRKFPASALGNGILKVHAEGDGCVNLGTQVFLVEQGRGLDEGQDACGKVEVPLSVGSTWVRSLAPNQYCMLIVVMICLF